MKSLKAVLPGLYRNKGMFLYIERPSHDLDYLVLNCQPPADTVVGDFAVARGKRAGS